MEIVSRAIVQVAIVSSSQSLLEPIARTALPVLKMVSVTILANVMEAQSFHVRQELAPTPGVTRILGVRNQMSRVAQVVAMMVTVVPREIIARTVIVIVAPRKTAMSTILVPMTDVCLEIVGMAPIQIRAMMATSVPRETPVAVLRAWVPR